MTTVNHAEENTENGVDTQPSQRVKSLGKRLLIIIALTFLVAGAVQMTLQLRSERSRSLMTAQTTFHDASQLIASQIGDAIRFNKPEVVQGLYAALTAKEGASLAGISVTSVSGTSLVNMGIAPDLTSAVEQAGKTALADGVDYQARHGADWIVASVVNFGGTNNPAGVVVTVWDLSGIFAAMNRAALINAVITLVLGGGGVLLLGVAIARVVSRPLAQMTESMGLVASGEFDTKIQFTERRDEIGYVARSLDEFRASLGQAEQSSAIREAEQEYQRILFERLSHGLQQLRDGDLQAQLETAPDDQMTAAQSAVCGNFNELVGMLSEVTDTIKSSADTVRDGSGEINQIANDLSQRSEAQAATLEQSAAALDELTSSVKSAAENASAANEAILENRRQAEAGGEIVRSAVAAMQQIEESSDQITQIIGVIDDITFQTNLLALNAGVEAALAGEAGRGFAVVASEVRALAQRASDSAKEIKSLISKSAMQVKEGGALVGKTGDALNDIIERVGKVAGLVSDIAASSKEQSIGLQEINTGVNELDQVTQQNAAVVKETTAASMSLSSEAERLLKILERFNTSGQTMPLKKAAAVVNISSAVQGHAAKPKPVVRENLANGTTGVSKTTLDEGWADF